MKTKWIVLALALCCNASIYAKEPVVAQKTETAKEQVKVLPDNSAALKTLKDGKGVLTDLSPMPEIKRWSDTDSQPRNFAQQPPVIPHTTKGYVINLKFNKCLTCHSDEHAKTSGATPVGKSHYSNRDGQATAKIAGRRYFCVQCHVPQVESEPLIVNDFQASEAN